MASIEVNYVSKCCGMKELNGLSWFQGNSKNAMRAVCAVLYPTEEEAQERQTLYADSAKRNNIDRATNPYGFAYITAPYGCFPSPGQYSKFRYLTFTEAQSKDYFTLSSPKTDGYGSKFADLIREAKLGTLVETGWEINPNSSNYLKVWVWGIDHAALMKWGKKEASILAKAATYRVGSNPAPEVRV